MPKFFPKLALMLLLLLLTGSVAHAQTPAEIDPQTGEGLSVGRCIKKGGLDFSTFWSSVIYNDDLKEGVVEPWKDIFNRNQCHALDVLALSKQQDSIRSSIRDAFLTCDTDQLPNLKTAFHKLTAEIYYVRHIVDGGIVVNLPYDLLKHRFFQESAIMDRTRIYNNMKKKYVKEDMLKQDQFDQLFLLLETKYGPGKTPGEEHDYSEDRLNTYIDGCENSSWKAVGEKWEELKKHVTEDAGGLNSFSEGVSQSFAGLKEEAGSIKIIDVIKGKMSLADYAKSFATANLNGLDFEEGLSEIVASVSEGKFFKTTPSQEELLSVVAFSEQSFETQTIQTKMLNNFSVLYGNVSDESIEAFVNNLDGRLTEDPTDDGFIEILHNTYPQISDLEKAAKTMNDRECPK